MHVLYVNDNWCFDTFSQRQYPLDEVLEKYKAKTYMCISIEDIEGRTYNEFKKSMHLNLKYGAKKMIVIRNLQINKHFILSC